MIAQLALGAVALLLGIGLSVQGAVNASLAKGIGSTVLAATVSFSVGTMALIAVAALSGQFAALSPSWRSVPLGYWVLGGLIGACFVALATFLVPRIGVAALASFAIAGQLAAGAFIDHFGLIDVAERSITLARAAGMVLLFVGALLVSLG